MAMTATPFLLSERSSQGDYADLFLKLLQLDEALYETFPAETRSLYA